MVRVSKTTLSLGSAPVWTLLRTAPVRRTAHGSRLFARMPMNTTRPPCGGFKMEALSPSSKGFDA